MKVQENSTPLISLLSVLTLGACYSGQSVTASSASASSGMIETTDATNHENASDTQETEGPPSQEFLINDWICEQLPALDVEDPQDPQEIDCAIEPDLCLPEDDKCVYTTYHGVEHLHEFSLYGPNNDVWVSQIVRGQDAQHGLITPIAIPQSPRTFSVSLENINGSPVGVMEEPTLSSYRSALKGILDQEVNGATPANISLKISQLYSKSSLQKELSMDLSWPGGSFFAEMFDANFEEQTVFMADLAQSYYSVTFDAEGMPADYLSPDLTVDDVKNYFPPGSSPLIINRLNYGRRAIVALKSTASSSEMKAAIGATFDYVVSGGLEVDIHHQQVLNSASIDAFILGDGGQQAILAISGFEGFLQFIAEGGNYTNENPGAPISFGFTNLKNQGQQFALTTDFAEAHCDDEVKLRITGTEFAVLDDAEGSGQSEFKWSGVVKSDGLPNCTLISQPDIYKLKSVFQKFYDPPGECIYTFPTDEPFSVTVEHWAGEFHNNGSLEVEDTKSIKYTFDPEGGTLSPTPGNYVIETYNPGDGTPLRTRMRGSVTVVE